MCRCFHPHNCKKTKKCLLLALSAREEVALIVECYPTQNTVKTLGFLEGFGAECEWTCPFLFLLFHFFLYSLINLLCRQPVSSFLTILLTHCVDGNTWTPFTPEHIKKQDSHQVLATSICFSVFFTFLFVFFLPSFSFVICRLLLLCHEDIFWEEKRPRMFTMSSTLKHLR